MMNSTKQQLHLKLQSSLSKIKSSQVINNCILISVMLLMGVYLCFKIHRYFAKMREVVNIIVDFSSEEMRKIIDYWNKISEYFSHIQGK
jgi:cell shape-determining protein MreC